MNRIIERIVLDASKGGTQVALYAKRGDTGTREFSAVISNHGRSLGQDEAASAVLNCKKPDGTVVYANCTVREDGIGCIVPSSTFAAAGRVVCELVVYDKDFNQLTAPRFEYVVEDVLYDEDALKSTDDYTALVEALATAKKFTSVSAEAVTLLPGEQATAEAELGDSGVAFTFGIPKGEKGDKGDKGEAGEGTGDMLKSVYDPNDRDTDIFAYVDEHINDKENPHEVTAKQVGAFSTSDIIPLVNGGTGAQGIVGAAANLSTNFRIYYNQLPTYCPSIDYGSQSSTGSNGSGYYINATMAQLCAALPNGCIFEHIWTGNVYVSGDFSAGSGYRFGTIGKELPAAYGRLIIEKSKVEQTCRCWFFEYGSSNVYYGLYEIVNGAKFTGFALLNQTTTSAVTSGSSALITSGGVYTALGGLTSLAVGGVTPTNGSFTNNGNVVRKFGKFGVLHLYFTVGTAAASGATICTLPSGYRPNATAFGSVGAGTACGIQITTGGVVTTRHNIAAGTWYGCAAFVVGN